MYRAESQGNATISGRSKCLNGFFIIIRLTGNTMAIISMEADKTVAQCFLSIQTQIWLLDAESLLQSSTVSATTDIMLCRSFVEIYES